MTVTKEITRADFVKQEDGTTTFCVEVTEFADSPFEQGQRIKRVLDPRPMTPERALQDHGLSLGDIVSGVNASMAEDNARLQARITELEAETQQLRRGAATE